MLPVDFSLFVSLFKDIRLSAYISLLLRDLVIWRCFDENPVLWDIMDFLSTGKYSDAEVMHYGKVYMSQVLR